LDLLLDKVNLLSVTFAKPFNLDSLLMVNRLFL
jgi:hypothetical protein